MNRCRRILAAALAAVMLLALTACGQSADTNNNAEQTVVRIGTPATGDHGARMLEAARVAAEKQYFEEELAKVGCRPEYVGFDGAGPAVNEAMISGDLDVAIYGDMPALVLASKFSGVTFIAMDNNAVQQGIVVQKDAGINSVEDLRGKRVIVIDDSIVRGTTSKRIVQLLKEAGAAEVHMRISSPPLKYPCFYGIDISTTKELIAAKKSVEEIRDFIGADSLAFLSLDGLVESIGLNAQAPYGGLCVAYFNGDYPTALDDYEADFLKSLTPEDRVRLPEFALYKSKYIGNEYNTVQPDAE